MLSDIFNYINNTNLNTLREELEKHGVKFKENIYTRTLLCNYQCIVPSWDKDSIKFERGNYSITKLAGSKIEHEEYKYESTSMLYKESIPSNIYDDNSRAA